MTFQFPRALCVGFAATLLLGGCGLKLDKALGTAAPGGAFEAGLHQGYIDLSRSEYKEADYEDSDAFAERAIALSGGGAVGPEALDARVLPAAAAGPLSAARARLVGALDATARSKIPGPAAHAQVMFDCWMQEQEENRQPADIARCRAGFESAMAEVEDAMRPAPVAEPAPARAAVAAPPDTRPRTYTVFFDFDSDALSPLGERVLWQVLDDWALSVGTTMSLVGHTDSSGKNDYNQALSERRVERVRGSLEGGNIAPARLATSARGEDDLAVATDDGVREPRNRRVEISID
jgi:OOP family OmpA-OmpF porin